MGGLLVGEGQDGLEEQFVDVPDHLPVHQSEVEDAGALAVDELHGHSQESLGDGPVLAVLDENA